MKSRIEALDGPALLAAIREALATCADGLDVSAVQPDTALAALVFDSLMALNFIASLEAVLGVADLPFEQWLDEHSERTDVLTVGSLIEWLRRLPELRSAAADPGAADAEVARSPRCGAPEEG